jgi:hypothetical protein
MLACNDGFRVRFYSAPALANELASPRCSRPITLRFTKHTGKQLFLDHLEISRRPLLPIWSVRFLFYHYDPVNLKPEERFKSMKLDGSRFLVEFGAQIYMTQQLALICAGFGCSVVHA